MKRTKKEAEKTRQAIIDAGMKVFSTNGLEASRIEDIAKAAGVTRGAFYHHFTNKLELYAHLLQIRAEYYRQTIRKCFDPELEPLERIRTYIVDVFKLFDTDSKFRAVSEMIYFKSGKEEQLKEITSRDELLYQIPTGIFIETLDAAKEKSEIRKDCHSEFMLVSIFMFIQGAIAFSMLNKGSFFLKENADKIVDTFLNGLTER
ncbi:TetR family transcriptional regulator [Calditrichota bacterium]